jgi:hypothetical protein
LFSAKSILAQRFEIIRHYNNENTCLPNAIYGLCKTSKGSMLLFSDKGLFVYDGNTFFAYNFLNKNQLNDEVFGAYEDTKGRIWLYTFKGKVAMIKNHCLYNYINDSTLDNKVLLPVIRLVKEDELGNIYFQAKGMPYFSKYDGKTIQLWLKLKEFQGMDFQNISISRQKTTLFLDTIQVMFNTQNEVTKIEKLQYGKVLENDKISYRITVQHNHLKINEVQTDISCNNLFLRTVIMVKQIKQFYFICFEHGLWIYDTVKHESYLMMKDVKVTDAEPLNNSEILLSTHKNGVYILSLENSKINQIITNIDIQKIIHTESQILLLLQNNQLKLYDTALNLKTTYNDFCAKQYNYENTLWKNEKNEINCSQHQTKLVIHGDLTSSKIDMKHPWEYKKIIPFQHGSYGFTNFIIAHAEPGHRLFETGRIFDIANYKDSCIFYSTFNGLKIYNKSNKETSYSNDTTHFINRKLDLNKILPSRYHYFFTTHGGNIYYTNSIFDSSSYKPLKTTKINGLPESVLSINDSILLVSFQDVKMLIVDKKEEVSSLFIRNGIIPKDFIQAFSIGNQLYVSTNRILKIIPYESLFNNNTNPTITEINSMYGTTNSTDSKINIGSNIDQLNCNVDMNNYDNKPYTLQYNFNGGEWVTSENNTIHFSTLNYGSNIISIRLVDFLENELDSRKIVVYRQTPFLKSNLFYSLALLAGFLLFYFLLRYYYAQESRKNEAHSKLELRALQNEFSSLNAMMNPHFVFNTLGNLQSLYDSGNNTLAKKYLLSFSSLIRKNMKNVTQELITLEDELSIVREYLNLESLRFGDDFNWTIDVDEKVDTYNIMIPPLLIQPIVENCIKHGLFKKQDIKNTILVKIYQTEFITIQVIDNGIGFNEVSNDEETHLGIAMKNIYERIERLNQLRQINIRLKKYSLGDNFCIEIKL